MERRWVAPALALALATAAACGQTEERQVEAAASQAQDAAAQLEAAGDQAEANANEAAKGLEAMAEGLAGAAGAFANEGKAVEPVGFKELQALFPEIPGWKRGKPTGERMTAPVAFSQAEVRYTNGDGEIELKIVDSGFQQLLLAPYTVFLTAGYARETESGYEKSTRVNSAPGWEKWDAASRQGEVNAVVGKRYLVQAQGSNVANIKVLQDAIARTDFKKLAALK